MLCKPVNAALNVSILSLSVCCSNADIKATLKALISIKQLPAKALCQLSVVSACVLCRVSAWICNWLRVAVLASKPKLCRSNCSWACVTFWFNCLMLASIVVSSLINLSASRYVSGTWLSNCATTVVACIKSALSVSVTLCRLLRVSWNTQFIRVRWINGIHSWFSYPLKVLSGY